MAKRRRRASGARKLLVTILLAVCAVALILYLTKGGGKVDNADLGLVEINEVMSSNKGSVPDETGDFPDWIEVYNNTDSPLDTSGYGLTDNVPGRSYPYNNIYGFFAACQGCSQLGAAVQNVDPLFVGGQPFDYRLADQSPLLNAAEGGGQIGAYGP